jgi:hypothetical protein
LNPEHEDSASKGRRSQPDKEQTMNAYQPSTFRPAFGVAALAMTVLTLVVSVIVPAGISSTRPPSMPALSAPERVATEVAIRPMTINVTEFANRAVFIETVNVVARGQRPAG